MKTRSYLAMLFYLRAVFTFLVICSALLMVRVLPSLEIDTDLADVTPSTVKTEGSVKAVSSLQANIEARILLLLKAENEDQLDSAEEILRERLTKQSNLKVHPSSELLADELVASLKPYRFNFLSPEQRERLTTKSIEENARSIYQQILSLGNFGVFDFTEDPTGWHGQALLELLPNMDEAEAQYRTLGLSIDHGAMDMRTQQKITSQLEMELDAIKQQYNVVIDRSGVFFFASHAARMAKSDISLISTVSTLGVIILLLMVFRSIGALFLPVASVVLGVTFAALVTHAIYGSLHILTIVFGASLIGIAIDYALHFMVHQSSSNKQASSQPLFRALALSLATSLIGYGALGIAGLPALEKVAVFSCSGLILAWLTVVCFGSSALRSDLKHSSLLSSATQMIRKMVCHLNTSLALTTLVLIVLAGVWLSTDSSGYSDDPRVFFSAPEELLESERRVAAVSSDFEPGRYLIVAGKNQAQVYARHAELMSRIKRQSPYSERDFSSLPNWLPSEAQQRQNYKLSGLLYEEEGITTALASLMGSNATFVNKLATEYGANSEATLSPKRLTRLLDNSLPPFWFENEDGSIVSFVLLRKGLNADQLSKITQDLAGIEYVNTLQRTSSALKMQRITAIKLLAVAMLLIAGLLFLRYRNWRAAGLVLTPLFSICAFIIVCAAVGVSLNLFHVMALFLVLGFGMDYVIFIHEMRDKVSVALQAIFLSSLTSLLSFGLLSMSDIPVVSSFGFTLLVGNTINLVGAFILANFLDLSNNYEAEN